MKEEHPFYVWLCDFNMARNSTGDLARAYLRSRQGPWGSSGQEHPRTVREFRAFLEGLTASKQDFASYMILGAFDRALADYRAWLKKNGRVAPK